MQGQNFSETDGMKVLSPTTNSTSSESLHHANCTSTNTGTPVQTSLSLPFLPTLITPPSSRATLQPRSPPSSCQSMTQAPQRQDKNEDRSIDIDPVTQQGSDLATTLLTLKTDPRVSVNEEETCKCIFLILRYCSEATFLLISRYFVLHLLLF